MARSFEGEAVNLYDFRFMIESNLPWYFPLLIVLFCVLIIIIWGFE